MSAFCTLRTYICYLKLHANSDTRIKAGWIQRISADMPEKQTKIDTQFSKPITYAFLALKEQNTISCRMKTTVSCPVINVKEKLMDGKIVNVT